jgi:hypothetical protein
MIFLKLTEAALCARKRTQLDSAEKRSFERHFQVVNLDFAMLVYGTLVLQRQY